MTGLFLLTLLIGITALSVGANARRLGAEHDQEQLALSRRDGTVFSGIPIPQFLIDIPFFGPLMKTFSGVVGGATGSVLNPAMDIVALLTSNYLSKTSPLFMFFDNALGGAFSVMSGSGGVIKPSVIDLGAITKVLSNTLTGVGGAGTSFLTPLINLFGIPGTVFGSILTQLATAFQQFPMLKLVNSATSPAGASATGAAGASTASVAAGASTAVATDTASTAAAVVTSSPTASTSTAATVSTSTKTL